MIVFFSVWGGSVSFAESNSCDKQNSQYLKMIEFLCDCENVEKVIIGCPSDIYTEYSASFYNSKENFGKLIFPHSFAEYSYTSKAEELDYRMSEDDASENQIDIAVYKQKTQWIYKALERIDLKADVGFVFRGLDNTYNNTLAEYTLDDHGFYRKPPKTALEAAQVTYYLNKTNIPWHLIATDSRDFMRGIGNRDVSNTPISCVSQYNDELIWRHLREFGPAPNIDEIVESFKIEYSRIEMISGYERGKFPLQDFDKKDQSQMIVFADSPDYDSGFDFKNYKYTILKKWVIDTRMDCVIYGKWSERVMRKSPEFAGNLNSNQINSLLETMKVTFVVPQRVGWPTQEIWKMISKGVVPLLHPRYDNQFSTVPRNHYIRCKDEADLIQKYEEIVLNNDRYLAIIYDLLQIYDPSCSYLFNFINKKHELNQIEPLKRKYEDNA